MDRRLCTHFCNMRAVAIGAQTPSRTVAGAGTGSKSAFTQPRSDVARAPAKTCGAHAPAWRTLWRNQQRGLLLHRVPLVNNRHRSDMHTELSVDHRACSVHRILWSGHADPGRQLCHAVGAGCSNVVCHRRPKGRLRSLRFKIISWIAVSKVRPQAASHDGLR